MKGEGCGDHKKDANGVWIRDDSCEWCQRHDWFLHESQSQEDLAKAICGRRDGPECPALHVEDEGWYDYQKSHWRTAGSVIGDMLAMGWTIVRAPVWCAKPGCGLPANDDMHHDITTVGGRKKNEDQHPFEEV